MKDDVSVLIREAQIFLDEEDTFMSKVSQGASNLVTGIKDLGKSLFSAPKPAGATAPGFAPTDTSTKAVVQTKLDTVLGQASKAAGATTPATAPASTSMRNSVANMINRIVEGTFDWQELRLYEGDFKDPPSVSKTSPDVYPNRAKIEKLLACHGYHPTGFRNNDKDQYQHEDMSDPSTTHQVMLNHSNLEWEHHAFIPFTTRPSATSSYAQVVKIHSRHVRTGRGIFDLNQYLLNFHRG